MARWSCIHNRDGIVVKYCRDIFGGELVRRVADEKTGLSDGTVANDHASRESTTGKSSIRRAVDAIEVIPGKLKRDALNRSSFVNGAAWRRQRVERDPSAGPKPLHGETPRPFCPAMLGRASSRAELT